MRRPTSRAARRRSLHGGASVPDGYHQCERTLVLGRVPLRRRPCTACEACGLKSPQEGFQPASAPHALSLRRRLLPTPPVPAALRSAHCLHGVEGDGRLAQIVQQILKREGEFGRCRKLHCCQTDCRPKQASRAGGDRQEG